MEAIKTLEKIQACFQNDRVRYTGHARKEMLNEVFGRIYEHEVTESILAGDIIQTYPEDKPYPSFLILGMTKMNRPLHSVCAHAPEDDIAIVITAYEPDSEKWVNYRERRK